MPKSTKTPAKTRARGGRSARDRDDITDAGDVELQEDVDSPELDDVARQIAAALSDSGDGDTWSVKVFRILGPAKLKHKQPWVMDCEPEDIKDLHQILRDQHRGGEFRVRVLKNGQFFKSFDVSVEPVAADPATPIAPATPIDAALARMESILERALTHQGAGGDPFDQLDKITSIMSKLNPAPASRSDGADLLEAFTRGMTLANKGAGERSFISEAADLLQVPAIAGLIENVADNLKGNRATAATSTVAAAAPAATPAPGETPNQTLLRIVNYLLSKAQRDGDPEFYALWVMEEMPHDTLKAIVNTPAIGDRICTLVPAFAEHRTWLDDLVSHLATTVNGSGGGDSTKTA